MTVQETLKMIGSAASYDGLPPAPFFCGIKKGVCKEALCEGRPTLSAQDAL